MGAFLHDFFSVETFDLRDSVGVTSRLMRSKQASQTFETECAHSALMADLPAYPLAAQNASV